jgi:hypothetical protein
VWVLVNHTPFSAERGFYRDRLGAEVWLAVLRGSFDVGPDGRVKAAETQTVPRRAAAWTGAPGESSLLDDSDFQPKRGTDLLIQGHAHAPSGRRVAALDVSMRLGNLNKTVRVFGERVWVRSGTSAAIIPGPANAFERVPLVYEKAFGGLDARAPDQLARACAFNPVGSGFCHRPEALIDRPAPQIESPGGQLVAGPEQIAPTGFGPIAAHWQPRAKLAGTYDDAWKAARAPLWPEDFRDGFFRSAPADQQLSQFLHGGEVVELTNMTQDGAFRVRLPELAVRMTTIFSDGTEQSDAPLQTVRIMPDERGIELSWLAAAPCQGREHKLIRARLACTGQRTWR